jgi:hypothetical protein
VELKRVMSAHARDSLSRPSPHTFGTGMAAAEVPIRPPQGWMGQRDYNATLVDAGRLVWIPSPSLVILGQGLPRAAQLGKNARR